MTRNTNANTAAIQTDDTAKVDPGLATPRLPRRERPKRTADRRDAGQLRNGASVPVEAMPDPAIDAVSDSQEISPVSLADASAASSVQEDAADTSDVETPVVDMTADDIVTAPGEEDGFNGSDLVIAEEQPAEAMKLSPQMKDAFLRFRNSKAGRRSPFVARAMTKLMRIRLPYPRQIQGMNELEELRLLGMEMRGEQQLAINIFERTGTGKSTLAEQFKLMCNIDAPAGTMPVCHARMGTSGTARDLMVAIMGEVQDGFATAGNEHSLRRRAMRALDEAGVQLLIIDETQHSGQKTGFSKEVTAELKIMLDTGRVPIVLLGTEKAVPMIAADRELSGRMFAPCRLSPLDMDSDDDFEIWTGLLKGLDARLVSDGILAQPVGLDNEDIADALGEATEGIIGQLMRVMLTAVRNVAREERDVMTVDDVIKAVDSWSIELKFAKTNALKDL